MDEPGAQDLERLVRDEDWERLRTELARMRPFDLAAELTRLPDPERAITFRLLPKDLALSTFEALDPPVQGELLAGLREDSVRDLFANLDPDDRVGLLDELPAKVVHRLLAQLTPRERLMTTGLLGYPPEAVGRVMSPEYVTVKATMSAGEALDRVRRLGPDAETVYTLPVVAEDRRLIGITSLRRLVLAAPEIPVSDLMSDPIAAPVLSDRESAARLLQAADLLALPIVDAEDRLVGVFTVDDAMAVLEGADTEDAARIGGSEPLRRPYLVANVSQIARSRAVWLLVLAATGALTVLVLDAFERELATVVALTLFVPLLIGTGGNAGAQAASTVIRAIAVGEVRFRDLLRVVVREAQVGVLLGAMLSAVAFPATTAFLALRGDPVGDAARIALVLSLSLLGICTLAATTGALMPVLATRIGIDPAVVSSPFITTVVDAGGLVIYLLIAKVILADMIGG